MSSKATAWTLATSILVLAAPLSQAADTADSEAAPLDEVLVQGQHLDDGSSATKTHTPLIETPQSVTVISGEEMDERVVQNLNEAISFTAGMGPDTRGNVAGRYDLLTLRGFTPDQYLDGLKLIGSANGYAVPQQDLAFVDRVEVLKGPASGLYGQASPGGIVALSSKLPTLDPFAEFMLEGGSFGTVRASVDLGGRIDDAGQFSYRLEGVGYHSQTETQHSQADRYGFSPALSWRPDENTLWTVLFTVQRDPDAGAFGSVPLQGSLLPNPNGSIPRNFYDGEPGFERFARNQNAVTSLFTRTFGDWSFHQNTRFMHVGTGYDSVYNLGFAPDLIQLYRSVAVANEGVDALTLDNQLSGKLHTGAFSHDVIAGVDYQYTHQTEAAGFGGSVASLDAFDPVYGATVTPPATSFNARLRMHQTGVYVQDQISYNAWHLVLSGRNDWVKSNQQDLLNDTASLLDQKKFTGRAGLLYLFDNGIAPYLSYTTSFQPQTATDRYGNILAPTQGKQTEAGIKYEPHVWDTMLSMAAYDLKQTNVATQDPEVPLGFGDIAAGEVDSRGIELEGTSHPFRALELRASYTYLNNFVAKDDSGLVGTHPYAVPQQTANAYALYTIQSGPAAGLGLGGAVRYLGRNFNGAAGADAQTIAGATQFDALLSYDLGRLSARASGLTFNLDATNLFNKLYITSCYSTLWCWYGTGRNVQASLRYRM